MASSEEETYVIKMVIGHQSMLLPKPTADGFTHRWSCTVTGYDCRLEHIVAKVVFLLHPTFARPRHVVKQPPYTVGEFGFGSFIMHIEVYFKTKVEPQKVAYQYDLELNQTNFASPAKVLRFVGPTPEFRDLLIMAGARVESKASANAGFSSSSSTQSLVKPITPVSIRPPDSVTFNPSASTQPVVEKKKDKEKEREKEREREKDKKDKERRDEVKPVTAKSVVPGSSSSAVSKPPLGTKLTEIGLFPSAAEASSEKRKAEKPKNPPIATKPSNVKLPEVMLSSTSKLQTPLTSKPKLAGGKPLYSAREHSEVSTLTSKPRSDEHKKRKHEHSISSSSSLTLSNDTGSHPDKLKDKGAKRARTSSSSSLSSSSGSANERNNQAKKSEPVVASGRSKEPTPLPPPPSVARKEATKVSGPAKLAGKTPSGKTIPTSIVPPRPATPLSTSSSDADDQLAKAPPVRKHSSSLSSSSLSSSDSESPQLAAMQPTKVDANGSSQSKTVATTVQKSYTSSVQNNSAKAQVDNNSQDKAGRKKQQLSDAEDVRSLPKANGAADSNDTEFARLTSVQRRLATLSNVEAVSKIVDIVSDTQSYALTDASFDFDLCKLSRDAVERIERVLASYRC